MNISTTYSMQQDSASAVKDALAQLENSPSLLVVYASVGHNINVVYETLSAEKPGVAIHGGTSCLGAMTQAGFHAADGVGLALMSFEDEAGNYGVGTAEIGADPVAAGVAAIQNAIAASGRFGEPPTLVWITGVPGSEEAVQQGIQSVIGSQVPIAGGSSADNAVAGEWMQFTNQGVTANNLVVTAMYPSTKISFAFHSGYWPTETVGKVTKANGRTLAEIDGRPAADVYNEWTNGQIEDHVRGGNVLADSTMFPLGRKVGEYAGFANYQLIHPAGVDEAGALNTFADVEEGTELILMNGSETSLISRAGRVAQTALNAGHLDPEDISGALVIYCAGCMLAVQDKMDAVASEIKTALGAKPFLGTFTFGEQGCFIGGDNYHGNLMISVVIFGK